MLKGPCQKREEVVAQGEREFDRYSNPSFPVDRRFWKTNCRPSLTATGVYIAYEEQGDPTGNADEQDKMSKEDEEGREQHTTTWSIDYAFMIDSGVLSTRDQVEGVGWDKTRDTVLVSEDLAAGRIRAHLVLAQGNGDPKTAGKIKYDIEEFGYGGAPVRIKSDQEPTQH